MYINIVILFNKVSLNSRVCIGELAAFYIFHGYGPLEPVQLTPNPNTRTTQKQPYDSAYEYGDVLNGINNACAITFHLYLVISLSVFLSLHN